MSAKLSDALNLNLLLEDQVTETSEKQSLEIEELKSDAESLRTARDVTVEHLEEAKSDLIERVRERDQLVEMNGDLQQQVRIPFFPLILFFSTIFFTPFLPSSPTTL